MASSSKGKEVDPFEVEMSDATALNTQATDTALSVHTNGLDKQFIDTVDSFEELMNTLAAAGISPVDANEAFNGGFTLTIKEVMKDVPHVIMDWKFSKGDYGEDFVIVRAMTTDNRKVVYNDGSTGIRQQLRQYEEAHGKNPVYSNGLRVSEYLYTDPSDGKEKPATTWYIG